MAIGLACGWEVETAGDPQRPGYDSIMAGFREGIFLNGTVGSGKTTVADCIGEALEVLGIAHAIIDLDAIRRAWPTPKEDRFNHELELVNLAALVNNYTGAGIEAFVIAGVIEDASEVKRYSRALGGRPLRVYRITASEGVIRTRLMKRHQGDPKRLGWHLARSVELENILINESLDDVVLDSTDRTPESVAREILELAGVRPMQRDQGVAGVLGVQERPRESREA
ncbi:AAA family ATPase [Arthrobacter sp. NPDC058127]|uniref:AAA family ATPase n=1 Tax=Arthrobacter sp. NPDC058127 TaxID=3346351 RepID=UPI0036E4DC93